MQPPGGIAAAGAPNEQLPIPGKDQSPQGATQPPNRQQFLLCGHVPKLQRAVVAVTGEGFAIRRKGNGEEPLFMTDAGAEQFAAADLPQPDSVILAGDGKDPSVR